MTEQTIQKCTKAEILEERVDKLEEGLNLKATKDSVDRLEKNMDSWNKVFIAIFFAMVGAIGGLYVLYFTGVSELKVDVAVIKTQVSQINKILDGAEITNIK